jgi:hypothetical protein
MIHGIMALESTHDYVFLFFLSPFGRSNSRGYDLNRNFPDYFKPNTKRSQPETEAVKDWISKIQFLLSGSLHGGALVWSSNDYQIIFHNGTILVHFIFAVGCELSV